MSEPLRPEELVRIGRYTVRRYIASGGMSWIFEVVDPELFDARRALKLLKPGETDREMLRRFRREAELLSRIQHPNLVHIYEFGEDPATGCSFYTMDFIEGRTLAQIRPEWLASGGEADGSGDVRSLDEIVRFFHEVLSALARLHAQGVVHRDIKPQNVFVDVQGRAVLGDLGIAKSSVGSDETRKGEMPGTPLYMAPEQSLGLEVTTRTDVFSLGLSLYRVVSGRTVYDNALGADSTNGLKVLRHLWNLQGASQEFEFVFAPEVPEKLRDVIRRACRMNPASRYPTATAMAEALAAAVRESAPAPALAPAPTPLRARRLGPAWIAGLGVLALLVLAGAWLLFGTSGDRSAALSARSDAEAAHALAASVVKQLAGRSDGEAGAALEDAQRRIAYTEEEQADGERELADGSYKLAERQFGRALEGYTRACQDLVDRWLRSAADAAVAAAAPATFSAAPEEKGCAAADSERARLLAAEASLRAPASPDATASAKAEPAPVEPATAAGPLVETGAAPAVPPATEVAPAKPAKPPLGARPALPDRTAEKRAIGAALRTWNRAVNARDWPTLQSVQKLRPGQLESYQRAFAEKNVRQKLTISWIAELSPKRFETEVVLVREERTFFVWRTVAREKRQAIAVLEGGAWKLSGL